MSEERMGPFTIVSTILSESHLNHSPLTLVRCPCPSLAPPTLRSATGGLRSLAFGALPALFKNLFFAWVYLKPIYY